jgi:hypothetical protein
MRRRPFIAAGLALAAASGGIAVASTGPDISSPLQAEFSATYQGPGGAHRCGGGASRAELRYNVLLGSITAGDPRLTCRLRLVLRQMRDARDVGFTKGLMRITDPATGRTRFRGVLTGVFSHGRTQAVLTGAVFPPARDIPGDRVITSLTWTDDETTISGQIGKDGPVAPFNEGLIVQRGSCRSSLGI